MGWKMESFRMAVYVFFPVGIFYLFNQPFIFEPLVIKQRMEQWPQHDGESVRQLNEIRERLRNIVTEESNSKKD